MFGAVSLTSLLVLLAILYTCLVAGGHALSNFYICMQIPYQANKATLVEKIAELVEEKVISFGADLVVWFVLTRAYSMMNLRYFEDHD